MTKWLPIGHSDAPIQARRIIQTGGLIILPTDTVYGIAASLWIPEAVAMLYWVKERPPDRAIPVLLADIDDIDLVAETVPDMARRLAEAFWPGPLTIAVPKLQTLPALVSSLPTVGVRIPDHAESRAIIRACGGALAVTSANISGEDSPLTATDAAQALGTGVALVLDGGPCQGGVPSTVVDVSDGQLCVVRQGPLSEATLQQVLHS